MSILLNLYKIFEFANGNKGKIGPHQGRIAKMMLNGTKPVCELVDGRACDAQDLPILLDAAKQGKVNVMEGPKLEDGQDTYQSYYFCQPDKIDDMRRLAGLFDKARSGEISYNADFHREVGHLLGYPEKDIEAYLSTLELPNP